MHVCENVTQIIARMQCVSMGKPLQLYAYAGIVEYIAARATIYASYQPNVLELTDVQARTTVVDTDKGLVQVSGPLTQLLTL